MKVSKSHVQSSNRSPLRAVSLHFRDNQVTVKVKTPVPQRPQFVR